MKKIITMLTAFCLMILSCGIVRAEDNTYKNGDWIYNSDTNKIVAYAGNSQEVTVPENSEISENVKFKTKGLYSQDINDYVKVRKFIVSSNVTIDGDLGFASYTGFEDVEFYNSYEQMQNVSLYFSGNSKLTTLVLPKNMKEIEASMCYNCTSLSSLLMPDSVTVINDNAFENCTSLTELILPKSLEKIGNKAFNSCTNIKKMYIPKNADYTKIDVYNNLENVEFENKPVYNSDFYKQFLNTKWMQNTILSNVKESIITDDGYLIKYKGNSNAIIPNSVKVIDESAFYQSSVESVTIPDTVTRINTAAFAKCGNLKEITFPKSVKYVEMGAFSECSSLAKLTIEGTVTMEDNVFEECLALTNDGIKINGKILYVTDNMGVESNPFAFTRTSYNREGYDIHATMKPTTEPTKNPTVASTPVATAVADAKETAVPDTKATAVPTQTPTAVPNSSKNELSVKFVGDELVVSLSDKEVHFTDAKPFIDGNNRTQVPIRAIAESIGWNVKYDVNTKIVTIKQNDMEITLQIGDKNIEYNGKIVKMDTAAQIVNDRTYVPIRYIAEALGYEVIWN